MCCFRLSSLAVFPLEACVVRLHKISWRDFPPAFASPLQPPFVGRLSKSCCGCANHVSLSFPVLFLPLSVLCPPGQRVCPFPGEPANGYIEPTRFHYSMGDGVSIICQQDYEPTGPAFIYCTSQGTWSSPLTACHKQASRPDLDAVIF